METRHGAPAWTAHREATLLRQVQAVLPAATAVEAHWTHFVKTHRPLTHEEDAVVQRLLHYGPPRDRHPALVAAAATLRTPLLVLPRPGTVSPWCSKATDIVRSCGLGDAIERVERGILYHIHTSGATAAPTDDELARVAALLHDRMTQVVVSRTDAPTLAQVFGVGTARRPLKSVDLGDRPLEALAAANASLGLALSADELEYLADAFASKLHKPPTDVELMMFAQVNSEHCRHKVFRASWTLNGEEMARSLFDMIKLTYAASPAGVLSAYHDNGAVLAGPVVERFYPVAELASGSAGALLPRSYTFHAGEPAHVVIKVETHNHPTAVSPYPGAATGSGGEIRDEGAVGRGATPKAGLVGFAVSDLQIPGFVQPWELTAVAVGKPGRISSAFDIMIEAPIGAAAFNNEFGRPALCGFFRTLCVPEPAQPAAASAASAAPLLARGYHKPIMIAGGLGTVRDLHVNKQDLTPGVPLVVLGGPAMLIGLGGGAASSVASGVSSADLDFASVQRDNAEMQRRCQEVISACWALGAANPIRSIHDVGAGGLSNALPELVEPSGFGAHFLLSAIPTDDPTLSPLEIWCNEAQERYVLAIEPAGLPTFFHLCQRERAPYAVVGHVTEEPQLVLDDDRPAAGTGARPIDLPMSVLFGKPPRMHRVAVRRAPLPDAAASWVAALNPLAALHRVLRLPAVASKSFLITIGDRTVGGHTARDQFVGPWQVPVADVAVTTAGYHTYLGEAMAMGERTPLALLDGPASGRMAVGEAITNIAAADVSALGDIKLSANWMAAAGHPGEDAILYDTVRAVGEQLCPALGIAIPVGKDSMSMKTRWAGEGGHAHEVVAPVSLVVSAFAVVRDVRRTLTPQLLPFPEPSTLFLLDLGGGQARLGGSALAQVHNQFLGTPPDLDDAALVRRFFGLVRAASRAGLLAAYHDRSDGGLIVTVLEMALAGRQSVHLDLTKALARAPPGTSPLQVAFAEELGAVVQVASAHVAAFAALVAQHDMATAVLEVGTASAPVRAGHPELTVVVGAERSELLATPVADLATAWSETSYRMAALRDDPECAAQEFAGCFDPTDPGLGAVLTFPFPRGSASQAVSYIPRGPGAVEGGALPRVAILREQGVNGQLEMAMAFVRAGFDAVDVHMTDLLAGRVSLDGFRGLAAVGGFSYGDVLGAGEGWAKSILFHAPTRAAFARFFQRPDTFAVGMCNGCQMLSALKEIIPGTEGWPRFVRNRSEQFEARFIPVMIPDDTDGSRTRSVVLGAMAGSRLPIAVAHGEGCAVFAGVEDQEATAAALAARGQVALRYTDNHGATARRYPFNPNGSAGAIAGVCSADGRVTIVMPHPERVTRWAVTSYVPTEIRRALPEAHATGADGDGASSTSSLDEGPWMELFHTARRWVDSVKSP